MNKKLAIPTILFLIILPVSIFALSQEKNKKDTHPGNQTQDNNAKIILYYSNQCPHCKNLEQWIEVNKIEDKIAFPKKEVHDDQNNANELLEKAAACQIPDDSIGVPFLWDGENGDKCIMGDSDIISFLENKINTNGAEIIDSSKNITNTK
jgi:glutaredoxin